MKILIVDDEPLARQRLTALVHETGIGQVVAELGNGKDIVNVVRTYHVDVVLLDIRMPGVDGMQAAHRLEGLYPAPAIIFTTAFGDRAMEAFDQRAADYLLKPIRKDRLEQALRRAYTLLHSANNPIPKQETKPPTRSHISANVRGNIVLVPIKEIAFFTAEEKYISLTWSKGEVLINETLKELEQEFAGQFLRIHRSTLVAIAHISSMNRDKAGHFFIKLKALEINLEVSRRHLPIVRDVLKDLRLPGEV
jgi:two-component system response regulator AlgR